MKMKLNLNLEAPKTDYSDPKNQVWIDVKAKQAEKQVKEAESPIKEDVSNADQEDNAALLIAEAFDKINLKGKIDVENIMGIGKFKSTQPEDEAHHRRLAVDKNKVKRQDTDNKSKARLNKASPEPPLFAFNRGKTGITDSEQRSEAQSQTTANFPFQSMKSSGLR